MPFSTKYLAEAVVLLGIAWAVIRWVGRLILDVGGSRDAEGHRFLESMWRRPRSAASDRSLLAHVASHDTAPAGPHDPRYTDHRILEVAFRELRADGPIAERAASMNESDRQAIYDDLVRQLEAGGVSDAERTFALTVAMKRLGLKGGRAADEVVKNLYR